MPRHLYFLCLNLVLLLATGVPASAQALASVQLQSTSANVTTEPSQVSLKSLLDQLESNFAVRFNYRAALVRSAKVSARPLADFNEGMTEQLNRLLAPLEMLCVEIDARTFVIREKRPLRKRQSPAAESPRSGGVSAEESVVPPANESKIPELEAVPDRSVAGRVTDAVSGEGLPGVNILLKGTQQGTTTDAEGTFSFTVPNDEAVLVFSFVGYASKEAVVGNRTALNITLSADQKVLEELVVIGYGTTKKSDLTGSVTRVNADVFRNQSMTQLTDMLTGTVAGFNANQSTSAAGGSSMEIRGPNSIKAGTSPMIVLDGVVYNGNIRDINPSDIESIDVLKDASSAAVFGARAASGVILITTVKGKSGKPTVSLSTNIGFAEVTRDDYAIRDPEGYINYRKDYYRYAINNRLPDYYYLNPGSLPQGVTVEQWREARNNPDPDNTREWLSRLNFWPTEVENYLAGKTINWKDQVMQRGLRQETNISVNGGTDRASYYWSIGYVNNDGIVKGDKYSNIRTRLNLDFHVTDWLKIGTNIQFSNRDESAVQGSIGSMKTASPYGSMWEEDGSVRWFPNGYLLARNPLMDYYGQERDRKLNNLFGTMFSEVNLPFGIQYRVSFQPRIESYRDYSYWSPETITGGQTYAEGRATRNDFSSFEWMVDNILKWNRKFGIHSFDVTLLHNAEQGRTWLTEVSNQTFRPSPVLGYSGIQFGNNPGVSSNDTKVTADALMARLNYSLKGRYLLTASVRRDGYSAFGQENPRATFPAAAVAWQVSNEEFFKSDLVSFLKLRLSWGRNGNRDIGAYSALAQMASNQYYDGSSVVQGVFTSSLANSGLKWEETESINLGLDLSILSEKISLTLDYYDMNTKNLLVNRTLPRITGFENVTSNIGELANKGFELTLNTLNSSSDLLKWKSDFMFSLNRNRIISLFGDTGEYTLAGQTRQGEIPDYSNEWFPGQAIDRVWNYNIRGVWQVEEAAEAAGYTLFPGDYKVQDLDGNGKYEALQDKMFIGYTQPRFRLGFRNTFEFLDNFTISFFLRSELGHIREFPSPLQAPGSAAIVSMSSENHDYWTAENRSNEYPRIHPRIEGYGGGIRLYKPSSFLRIQDLTFSYRVPLLRDFMKESRIFGSVRNLYSFDNWPGWDPESGNNPMPRLYNIGVSVSF